MHLCLTLVITLNHSQTAPFYWYGHLQCRVGWNDMLGDVFSVSCGVRQGAVLSPYLFAVYTDDLITHLKNSGYGIYVGQTFTGCAL